MHSLKRQVGGCAGVFVLAPCAPPEMVMPVLLYIGIEALMGWRASCRVRKGEQCNMQRSRTPSMQNTTYALRTEMQYAAYVSKGAVSVPRQHDQKRVSGVQHATFIPPFNMRHNPTGTLWVLWRAGGRAGRRKVGCTGGRCQWSHCHCSWLTRRRSARSGKPNGPRRSGRRCSALSCEASRDPTPIQHALTHAFALCTHAHPRLRAPNVAVP